MYTAQLHPLNLTDLYPAPTDCHQECCKHCKQRRETNRASSWRLCLPRLCWRLGNCRADCFTQIPWKTHAVFPLDFRCKVNPRLFHLFTFWAFSKNAFHTVLEGTQQIWWIMSGSSGRASCTWTVGVRTQVKTSQVRLWGTVVLSLLREGWGLPHSSHSSAFQAAGQHKAGRRQELHSTSKRPALAAQVYHFPFCPAPRQSPGAGDATLPKAAVRCRRLPTRWASKRVHRRHFLLFSLFPQTSVTFGQTHFSYSKEGPDFFYDG